MATFNPKSFDKKLKSLDGSQTGIETLSLWILHHRQHANIITATWLDAVRKSPRAERRLGLFYLSNDVVQNGRRKAKDLVSAFGNVMKEATPFLCDDKIKAQVERVFNIWLERSVFDAELITELKKRLGVPSEKNKKEESKDEKTPETKAPPIQRKQVPPDFKVASLLVSVKKTTNLDHDVERKSKALENLKIDASSFESIKHIKDRSSVGRFHKQFQESKVILDDYIHTLKKSEKDKKVLMNLLSGGEAFYEVAQDEAKVIVNAYSTFGNRLNLMKKKLDSKLKKLGATPTSTGDSKRQSSDQLASNVGSTDEKKKLERISSVTNIEDMDLDSDSEEEVPPSQRYNPSTAPSHGETTPGKNKPEEHSKTASQALDAHPFFNPVAINGMTTYLNSTELKDLGTSENNAIGTPAQQTPLSEGSVGTPDSLVIAEDKSTSKTRFTSLFDKAIECKTTAATTTTPVLDEQRSDAHTSESEQGDKPLQSLIDSLFPVLSKSLQTIKEKQQAVDDANKPSVNDAIAYALGAPTNDEVARKKTRFDNDAAQVSLTNPKGLSETQTELISIAVGITKFGENFLPVTQPNTSHSSDSVFVNHSMSNDGNVRPSDDDGMAKGGNEDYDRRRDDRKSRHNSGRHRRRSSSRSPSRRSSHRSRDGRDGRDERHFDRRKASRRSPSPRKRRGSRGRRSSSQDRERRFSPDSKKAPYYNDRRSPTPELDSAMNPPPQFNTQAVTGSIMNPLIPAHNHMISNSNPNFANPNSGVANQPFHLAPNVQTNDLNEAKMRANFDTSAPLNMDDPQQKDSDTSQPNAATIMQLTNSLRPPMQPCSVGMNAEERLGPSTPFPMRAANPLQLLQQTEHQPFLHPVGQTVISLNPPQHQLFSHQLGEDTKQGKPPPGTMSNPIQKLSQQSFLAENEPFQSQIAPNIQSFDGPPPFPGPPPVFRPTMPMQVLEDTFPQQPIFRPRYAPRFAEPDPLLDQLEQQQHVLTVGVRPANAPPDFSPRFKPNFDLRPAIRFRPRFNARPPFHGRPVM